MSGISEMTEDDYKRALKAIDVLMDTDDMDLCAVLRLLSVIVERYEEGR